MKLALRAVGWPREMLKAWSIRFGETEVLKYVCTLYLALLIVMPIVSGVLYAFHVRIWPVPLIFLGVCTIAVLVGLVWMWLWNRLWP